MVPEYIIATDAGVFRDERNGEVPGAYAFVILNCKTMKYTIHGKALNGKGINYCEGYAIYKALQMLGKYTKAKPTNVLVISDSKLTVQALTIWSKQYWNTSNPFNWKKSQGGRVKNQEIYRKIQNLERDLNLTIKYVHINSHKNIKDKNDVTKMKYKIINAGVNVSNAQAKLIMKMNAWADEKATEVRNVWLRNRRGFITMIPRRGGEDDE